MANLTTEANQKINEATSEFKNKNLNGEHSLEKIAQNASDRVGAMASNFANMTAESMKSSRDYVKENPITCIAIAATTGLVAGSLLTMIMRNRKD